MLLSGPKVLQESLYQTETTLQSHGQFKLTCQAEGIPSQHILWENSWLISCQLVLHKSHLIKKKKKKNLVQIRPAALILASPETLN